MEEKFRKIYDGLSSADRKAFRAALESDNKVGINAYVAASGLPKQLEDIPEKPGRGRPQVVSKEHTQTLHRDKRKAFHNIKTSAAGAADVLEDINIFKEEYNHIIETVCADFYDLHADIIKRPPFMWVNSLLLELKKQLPIINVKNAQQVAAAWDCYTGLMYKVGLFPTMEAFTCLTGVYRQQLNKELSPEHEELKQKIFNDCRDNMVSQVAYNPMTQVNKLFLLKSVYGFREDQAQQQQTTENKTKNINDIPLFSLEDKQDQQ